MSSRLSRLRSQLERSADPADQRELSGWAGWWNQAHAVGVDVPTGELDIGQGAGILDSALRQLDLLNGAQQRRLLILNELLSAAAPTAGEPKQLEAPLKQQGLATGALDAARAALLAARDRATERARQRQTEQDRNSQLAELARLAIKHLDDQCPVCTQPYDREITLRHLHDLMAGGEESLPSSAVVEDDLPELAAAAAEAQTAVAAAESALEAHRAAESAASAAEQDRARRLADLGLEQRADETAVQEARQRTIENLEAIERLRASGEELALSLARRGQAARREELEREAEELTERTSKLETDIAERNRTGDLAQARLDATRSAAADVVGLQLEHLQPLLQRIYARIDPHPALREPALRSWTERGRGRLRTSLSDPGWEFETERPETVLSSSQLNAFAVATFLTLNMGVPRVPLATAILDDPLQSLDDVDLLGLVDLMRRIKERRQLIVSTHDARFGNLLERKLRAIGDQRTVRIDLAGWSRQGPVVSQRDVPPDRHPLRLVA